jgi:twinkle protein
MNDLRVLVQELDIALFVVSHLRRPQSEAGHEGGAKVQLSQLRGSHAIAQLADACIGLEVDADDPTSGLRNLVVLKNRHTGQTGNAGTLRYDRDTGRLSEVDEAFDSDVPF